MSEERLVRVIEEFSHRNLNMFFRSRCENYAEDTEDLNLYNDERFSEFQKLGEIRFDSGEKLIVASSLVKDDLTERSGKKAQYEKAKNILKDLQIYDAGFFIFNDASGDFRFSLIYAQFQSVKRTFSNFRRFTYFVSKDQTNKTFLKRVGECDYFSLETIKDAFSVEKVNKEFYGHVARFFYRLTEYNHPREMKLPSVPDEDKKIYQEFAVRLIGRAIFCWFLKHKRSPNGESLIPESILSSKAVRQDSQYYHSVLEKLFFEVLNTPLKDRKGDIFENADKIPFLNGGLFEPHKDDFYPSKPLYNLVIPDSWFGQFFETLEQYNFTIDENSTIDADVSVDPEMLGRIFENLLAEVNPETGETARKATGSYYTPRTIVDYMVDQSLKQYLLTKTRIDEDRITSLLSYEVEDISLADKEKSSIISALGEIKIIDPACGSGAFPMGILHKMLLMLQKVDPDLSIWLRNHLGSIEPGIFRDKLLERIKKENWEYVRKLLIIQNSIYGVDIQPIAVEISKLRFFLSLIVDEKIEDAKENRGIEALPNLEFKFVAANSLLGLPPAINRQIGFGGGDELNRLKELRNNYLRSYGKEKKKIEEDFRQTRGTLIEHAIKWGGKDALALQLASWDPFSNEACNWFDPEWMFGIENGFEIVIANPPYILLQSVDIDSSVLREIKRQFASAQYKIDTYQLFIELAIRLTVANGILTYITPNTFLKNKYSNKLRKILVDSTLIQDIVLFFTRVFEASSVDNLVIICKKAMSNEYPNHAVKIHEIRTSDFSSEIQGAKLFVQAHISPEDYLFEFDISEDAEAIIRKIGVGSVAFGEIGRAYFGIQTFDRNKFVSKHRRSSFFKSTIDGTNVQRYRFDPPSEFVEFKPEAIKSGGNPEVYKKTRIVVRQIGEFPFGTLCPSGLYTLNTVYNLYLEKRGYDIRYILAILNSHLIKFFWLVKFYDKKATFPKIKKKPLESIPIKVVSEDNQNPFILLVDQILAITKEQDYLSNPTKQSKVKELERQIDQMVYELYGLTTEEIEIVEGV